MITDANTDIDANSTQDSGETAPRRPSSPMTFLFLVRHGENDWVETGKLAGRTPGVHLNEKGREQASFLAQQLGKQPISAIYSSPLERCVETAQPLADALNIPIQEDPDLLEVDYGEWRGGALKELAKLPEWQLVQVYPGGFRFPQGETLREVQHRVVTGLERIRSEHEGKAIVVFAHGDILRTTLAYYLGAPLDLFQRIQISTASVSLIGFHRFGPRILLMNYTGELPLIEWEKEKEGEDEAGADGRAPTGEG